MKSGLSPRTILFISLYAEFGGGEFGLYYLLKHINRSKFKPVVVFNSRGPVVDAIESLGIETVQIPFRVVILKHLLKPSVFGQNWKAAVKLANILHTRKVDIVQCSDVLSLLLLVPAMLRYGIPVVYSVIFFYERLRAWCLNILAPLGVRSIVTLSKAVSRDLSGKTAGLNNKMRLIYWGLDTDRFYPRTPAERDSIREKFGLPLDKKIIGFIGRYEVWKGHRTFLDAAEDILRSRDDCHFIVAGGAMTQNTIPAVAEYKKEIDERIKKISPDKITVLGHRDDIPDLMSCLDVFVCPSDAEPFGLVVPEALACGISVVASSSVGALEVLKNNEDVFIAEPCDSGSFAAKIVRALEHITLVSHPIRPLPSGLSWERYTLNYEELYTSIFDN